MYDDEAIDAYLAEQDDGYQTIRRDVPDDEACGCTCGRRRGSMIGTAVHKEMVRKKELPPVNPRRYISQAEASKPTAAGFVPTSHDVKRHTIQTDLGTFLSSQSDMEAIYESILARAGGKKTDGGTLIDEARAARLPMYEPCPDCGGGKRGEYKTCYPCYEERLRRAEEDDDWVTCPQDDCGMRMRVGEYSCGNCLLELGAFAHGAPT